jgi:hypothetical protein
MIVLDLSWRFRKSLSHRADILIGAQHENRVKRAVPLDFPERFVDTEQNVGDAAGALRSRKTVM